MPQDMDDDMDKKKDEGEMESDKMPGKTCTVCGHVHKPDGACFCGCTMK